MERAQNQIEEDEAPEDQENQIQMQKLAENKKV